jgi:hypothetical protein
MLDAVRLAAAADAAGSVGWPSSPATPATRTVTSYLPGGLLMPGTASAIYNTFGVRWASPASNLPTRGRLSCPS